MSRKQGYSADIVSTVRSRVASVALVIAGLILAGCVSNAPESRFNKDKALASHIQLGLSYLQKRNRDMARLHLNKAVELDDDSAQVHNGLALLYQLDSEKELAEKHFIRAIKSDRSFSTARFNYGSFLYFQKRYEDAFEQFERVSKDLDYDLRPSALANVGRCALKLGNSARAQAAFEHALSLDERQAVAMIELAELSFNQKEYAESKKYLDRFSGVTRATARSLWLGIRIERIFGNKDKEASYALALKNLHPYSKEYLEYQKQINNQ